MNIIITPINAHKIIDMRIKKVFYYDVRNGNEMVNATETNTIENRQLPVAD